MPAQYETLCQSYASLVTDNLDPKKYFTKKKYPAYFEDFCKEQQPLFEQIQTVLNETENKTALVTALAQAIAAQAAEDVSARKGLQKENRKSELNLYMVTSIFPCTLRLLGEDGPLLCEEVVSTWKTFFPGTTLGYSTYEKLSESFRSFFGFLTGR